MKVSGHFELKISPKSNLTFPSQHLGSIGDTGVIKDKNVFRMTLNT